MYRLVGSLKSFNREDSSVFYNHCLPNIECCDFLRNLPAEINVGVFTARELRTCNQIFCYKKIFHECRCRQERDSDFLELVGNGAKD